MTDAGRPADFEGTGTYATVPEDECRELLSLAVIGRVAFNSSGGLQLIPLNYYYLDGGIYFRVDTSSVLGELGRGSPEVVFEVDYHDDLIKQAWSVMVRGQVSAVTDSDELNTLQSGSHLQPWALGDRQLILRLEPETITGRKVKRNAHGPRPHVPATFGGRPEPRADR